MGRTTWKPEEDALLRLWWSSKSATEMRFYLPGKSRSAILGRIHRLNVGKDVEKPKPPPKRAARPRRTAEAKPALTMVRSGGLALAALTDTMCRYPLDGSKTRTASRFCAAPVIDDGRGERSSWCAEHFRLCHAPTPGVRAAA